ncbi:Ger(x)C family spore germination protein [Paenibacillus sp. SAFN-117]|uniref:Ger(x)C family spore germination protein n=1 Tax=Paenibacillus sp. SAFN-117 TaxID=3436860 RepID=UPI003F7EB688
MNRKLLVCLLMLTLLSGCWDIKDMQIVNYAVSVGLDYKDGKYLIYAQMIEFTSIARQESGKQSNPPQQWVGKGEGETINQAINDLLDTAQQRTYWSHATNIIMTKRLLEQGVDHIEDTLFRFREMRYTPWIYGTEEEIEDVYTTPGFFNLPSLATILNEPIELYKQKSYIAPMQYFRFVSLLREPDQTILLPSISINKEQWHKNNKVDKKLEMNGVYALQNYELKGFFDKNRLAGLRWLESRTERTPLVIRKEGKSQAVLSMNKPEIDIKPHVDKQGPVYSIHVKITGDIIELTRAMPESKLVEEAQRHIEGEIMTTYRNGLEKKADLFSLQHVLYRKHYGRWRKLQADRPFQLKEDSIQAIEVEVKLKHSGMLRDSIRTQPAVK